MAKKNNFFKNLKEELAIKELAQSAVGCFTAILLFFALRDSPNLLLTPNAGFIITVLLVIVYYNGFTIENKISKYFINFAICFLISALLANLFGLVDPSVIWTFGVFGTPVIIGVWLGFPAALLFDKYNFINPLKRQYINTKR